MGGKNNQKNGLVVSICLLCVLVVSIVFIVTKDSIISNLKETNFFERVGHQTPKFIEKYELSEKSKKGESSLEIEVTPGPDEIGSINEVKPVEQDDDFVDLNSKIEEEENRGLENSSTDDILIEENRNFENSKNAENENLSAQKNLLEKNSAEKENLKSDSKKNQTETTNKKVEEKSTPAAEVQKPVETTKVNLCFVYVDFDGTIVRKIVPRQIAKSDAPLTNTIKTLLKGPTSQEKNCLSLIPSGTKLLGASVKNGIATLNFSQEFEFGGINADSYRAELMQIVFTATEFSTVKSVQFLIEGQRKDYMGSEDYQIWIGSPYSRSNF